MNPITSRPNHPTTILAATLTHAPVLAPAAAAAPFLEMVLPEIMVVVAAGVVVVVVVMVMVVAAVTVEVGVEVLVE